MEKERKIALVVRRMSFADAERADNIYWAKATYADRLNELHNLRKMMSENKSRIQKVVYKRNINEEKD